VELSDEQKKINREDFISKYFDFFHSSELAIIRDRNLKEYPNLTYLFGEKSEQKVNRNYWFIRSRFIQPIIHQGSGKSEDSTLAKVDLYKILSCLEYSIMIVKPIVVLNNGEPLIYDDTDANYDPKHVEIENITNAQLAFQLAYAFLSSWEKDYKRIFSNDEMWTFLNSTEEIYPRSEDSMSYLDEHIAIIAYSVKASALPIFTNSTWWRLLCIYGYKQFS